MLGGICNDQTSEVEQFLQNSKHTFLNILSLYYFITLFIGLFIYWVCVCLTVFLSMGMNRYVKVHIDHNW